MFSAYMSCKSFHNNQLVFGTWSLCQLLLRLVIRFIVWLSVAVLP